MEDQTQQLEPDGPELMELLAEALRAGPASPPWRRAVELIGVAGDQRAQYQRLCRVREDLESGRQWRSVRAGPGFTRRVMENLEQAPPRGGWPVASLVAWVSLAILLGLGLLLAVMFRGQSAQNDALADLERLYFLTPLAGGAFDGAGLAGWKPVGAAIGASGLSGDSADGAWRGGALVYPTALAADRPVALEALLNISRPAEELIFQLFVSDQADFDAQRATTPHELVWMIQGRSARLVLPDGTSRQAPEAIGGGELRVRLVLQGTAVVASVNGRRVYGGVNMLDGHRPRTLGIRFLQKGQLKSDALSVSAVRILRP